MVGETQKVKILLTGKDGQLGKAVQEVFCDEEIVATGPEELDIRDKKAVFKAVNDAKPDVIINAAAYTDVKRAEEDKAACYSVNALGPLHLAAAADINKCLLIHVSTDFVFNGRLKCSYTEADLPNPVNFYGLSKLAGEQAVMQNCRRFIIARTAWLYGEGKNFVQTIINLAQKNKEIPVVADQVGTPTYTVDLANALKELISKEEDGLFHVANDSEVTRADFAREILRVAGIGVRVKDITSPEYSKMFSDTIARPLYTPLQSVRLYDLGIKMRPWQEALREYLLR